MPEPPVAKKIPKTDVVHGDVRQDDYFWLRDKDSPDTLAYLNAENAYTEALTAPTAAFQDALYREMLARIKEDDQSVPYPYGGWLYYSRTETGKQYAIHCRKRTPDALEEVTVDLNALAEGHPFCALGAYSVSDDGRWLAYTIDFTGFRDYTLYLKDLTTGGLAPERIEKVSSVAWAADSQTFFYVLEDDAKRPYRLCRHRLGAPMGEDAFIYDETDALFRLGVWRSRSRAMVFAASTSFTTTELRWPPSPARSGAWCDRASTTTSTGWTTRSGRAAGRSTFVPTRAAVATSGWSRRRWTIRPTRTGASWFRIATTSCWRTSTCSPTTWSSTSAPKGSSACTSPRWPTGSRITSSFRSRPTRCPPTPTP